MSADNGIYILRTKGDALFSEYRVVHTQCIDNIYWDKELEKNNFPEIDVRELYLYFNGSKVFFTEEEAFKEANRLYKGMGYIEYGIQIINALDIELPKKCPKCCESPSLVSIDGEEQCYNCGETHFL